MRTTFFSRNPAALLVVAAISTGYGIHLIIRGLQGDTLMPGTNFTYIPRWIFIAAGLLLQLPLPGAIWFLVEIGYIKWS